MTESHFITKRGRDLQPGDSVSVWFAPGGATIFEIFPYIGPLEYLFPDGSQTAVLAANVKAGSLPMTIDNAATYQVRRIKQPHGVSPVA